MLNETERAVYMKRIKGEHPRRVIVAQFNVNINQAYPCYDMYYIILQVR